jgi:HEPN domain-containing protein
MKQAVVRWLEFAEIDLKAARTLLKEGSLSPVVCFHAQQSVEKCLKALIESMLRVPIKSFKIINIRRFRHGESCNNPDVFQGSGGYP